MAFTRSADGVAKQGKTKGKNLGNSGPSKGVESGPAHKVGGGKTDADLLKMGRGLAKVAAQKRG
jgi:hypothetical protein